MKKPSVDLTQVDFKKHPVWELCTGETAGETPATPAKKLPVDHLKLRLVGCDLRLSNGSLVFGILGNIKVNNVRRTRQFLSVSVCKGLRKFHLARYFDSDEKHLNGPEQLAQFLELPLNEVFPITYDISEFVDAQSEIVRDQIPLEPIERLTPEQRRNL